MTIIARGFDVGLQSDYNSSIVIRKHCGSLGVLYATGRGVAILGLPTLANRDFVHRPIVNFCSHQTGQREQMSIALISHSA